MSHPNKLKNISMSPIKHYADGAMKEKSNINSLKGTTEDTTFRETLGKKLSTVESQVSNRREISKGKLNSCKKNIPIMKSSKISGVESITKDPVFAPFSNRFFRILSRKLWLPPLTDSPDSIMNYLSGFSKTTEK